jgi:hypothetical protein
MANQSNLLEECACLVLNDEENFLILLGKFKIGSEINDLSSYLKSNLTDHFLPNLILPLQSNIPLNINGKIDRTKLFLLYSNTINKFSNTNLTDIWQVR